jgi:hypothetical protein
MLSHSPEIEVNFDHSHFCFASTAGDQTRTSGMQGKSDAIMAIER